jgi:hypothetical protein
VASFDDCALESAPGSFEVLDLLLYGFSEIPDGFAGGLFGTTGKLYGLMGILNGFSIAKLCEFTSILF